MNVVGRAVGKHEKTGFAQIGATLFRKKKRKEKKQTIRENSI